MTEHLDILRQRIAKAEAREARALKAWETAKTETAELHIALRVMSELAGESPTSAPTTVGDRQRAILQLLPIGEATPSSPADLFEAYSENANEEINIDTFRTTVWRMKDKAYNDEWGVWLVKGDSGNYWREPASMAAKTAVGNGGSDGVEREKPGVTWDGPTGRSDSPFSEDFDDSEIPF